MHSKHHFPKVAGQQPGLKKLFLSVGVGLLLLLATVGSSLAIGPVVDLNLNQQDVTIRGDQANGYLSELTASKDFNGDGYDDLLLGAAGHDHNGTLAGAAYMIRGGPNMASSINLNGTAASFTLYGAQSNDALGHSVAGGDVNGDGVSDMIISADGYNNGSERGAVYVVLGGAGLFANPVTMDLAVPGTTPAVTITGASPGDRLGRSVASGDINNDNIDDIVVGAYNASPGGRFEAGAVYAILGRASFSSSTPTTINLASTSAALTIYGAEGGAATVLSPEQESQPDLPLALSDDLLAPEAGIGDRLGRSVSVGDINGDGIADVIAGAYGADVSGKADAGKTYVFYGSPSFSSSSPVTINLNSNPGDASITLSGIDAGDQSGFYVSHGNLNKDAYADLLIGAYFSKGAGNVTGNETGEAYVIYGGGSLSSSINLASGSNVTVYGGAAGDRLGRSLASTDANNDGYEDLIAGASQANPNGRADAGEAYVIYGSGSLPTTVQLPAGANVRVQGAHSSGQVCTDTATNRGSDCSDEAGHATAAGDINGDGTGDVIVGAIFANNGALQDAGAAYVIYGAPVHGPAVGITITPDNHSANVGDTVSYTAIARDAQNKTWNVTAQTVFSISAGAGGTWSGNVYTAQNTGNWTVTGTYQGLPDTASLTVIQHGPAVAITIHPDTANAGIGQTKIYTAQARDAQNHTWDVTPETTFSIQSGAGGSWSGNIYTTQFPGTWMVTGVYQTFNDTAVLNVLENLSPLFLPVIRK